MRVLHLTLKKKWFDMIASGEKKEEYRQTKEYWFKRLTEELPNCLVYKRFDIVRFKNGYSKNAPVIDIEHLGTTEGYGKREWGSEGKYLYIIKLGKIINPSNQK